MGVAHAFWAHGLGALKPTETLSVLKVFGYFELLGLLGTVLGHPGCLRKLSCAFEGTP